MPYQKPRFPLGTAENPFARTEFIGCRMKRIYDEYKAKGFKHIGLYFLSSPSYLVIEPEYVKNIMSRDFRFFTDRGTYSNEKSDPLSGHLFNLEGDKWKNLRYKLTPTFTSGKMKMMFSSLVQCGKQLKDAVDCVRLSNAPIDAKEVLGCFTTDVIGSCAFGLDCNSFLQPNSEFREYGKIVFTELTKSRSIGAVVAMASPKLAQFFNIVLTPRHITNFFLSLVKETVRYRKDNDVVRKDFMQILMDLQDGAQFSIEEMAANTFVFFLAGFETSSTTMSFALYEMAKNPKIQNRVRDEVNAVLEKHGDLTYEAVNEFKYLGQVVDETLRMYPPGALMSRICVEEYKIPDTDVTLDKGTRVIIPIYGLHRDAEYYPNPEHFDPDRFSEENVAKRHPFVYLPFGAGPRICIGLRFGLMQSKLGLAILIRNFQFSVNSKTKIPIEIDPTNLILSAKDPIWLDVHDV
ncbi:hypothetical protein RN001_011171 [Aquatica leii]|uniref:Cytochrome P450 n=1 Tax=Aquatica leii TaxID=1421715 RepID=A0AAN7P1Y9_9COLE|nr:hypothetical protein RN001_011171 [Aquatica leii]